MTDTNAADVPIPILLRHFRVFSFNNSYLNILGTPQYAAPSGRCGRNSDVFD